jgi:hypothetical protein
MNSLPDGTPPIFFVHRGDDIISPPEHRVLMGMKLGGSWSAIVFLCLAPGKPARQTPFLPNGRRLVLVSSAWRSIGEEPDQPIVLKKTLHCVGDRAVD